MSTNLKPREIFVNGRTRTIDHNMGPKYPYRYWPQLLKIFKKQRGNRNYSLLEYWICCDSIMSKQ